MVYSRVPSAATTVAFFSPPRMMLLFHPLCYSLSTKTNIIRITTAMKAGHISMAFLVVTKIR